MSEHNPYHAPDANVADVGLAGATLAGRGERLGAAIIDGLILVALVLPLMVASGYFSGVLQGQQPGLGAQLLWGLAGFVIFVLVQGFPLNATGQTWGKKLLKVKIVDMQGAKPDFVPMILKRYGSTQAISLIPFVGVLYAFVNVLFIFGKDKRCLHDRIAGTQVVIAR